MLELPHSPKGTTGCTSFVAERIGSTGETFCPAAECGFLLGLEAALVAVSNPCRVAAVGFSCMWTTWWRSSALFGRWKQTFSVGLAEPYPLIGRLRFTSVSVWHSVATGACSHLSHLCGWPNCWAWWLHSTDFVFSWQATIRQETSAALDHDDPSLLQRPAWLRSQWSERNVQFGPNFARLRGKLDKIQRFVVRFF